MVGRVLLRRLRILTARQCPTSTRSRSARARAGESERSPRTYGPRRRGGRRPGSRVVAKRGDGPKSGRRYAHSTATSGRHRSGLPAIRGLKLDADVMKLALLTNAAWGAARSAAPPVVRLHHRGSRRHAVSVSTLAGSSPVHGRGSGAARSARRAQFRQPANAPHSSPARHGESGAASIRRNAQWWLRSTDTRSRQSFPPTAPTADMRNTAVPLLHAAKHTPSTNATAATGRARPNRTRPDDTCCRLRLARHLTLRISRVTLGYRGAARTLR